MSSNSSVWRKIRKRAKAIFCKSKDQDCSKEKRRAVRKVLSNDGSDLEHRIGSLRKAFKSGHITKKQYRLAKKLIVSSYE
jgi:hypothetical protein